MLSCLGFSRQPLSFPNYHMHLCCGGQSVTGPLLLFCLTVIHMYSLFTILFEDSVSLSVGTPCYSGQIIEDIHTKHILEQGNPIWLYLQKNIFCHILSFSLTTILVFYNYKSGAGILNITLFFTCNIKSKMIVFIRH